MTDNAVIVVDFDNEKQCADLVNMLIDYSSDLMGGGVPLERDKAKRSIALMRERPYTTSFLAYDGARAVGFANCFETVATFAAKTAINIHDLAVTKAYRGKGISQALLHAIENYAKSNAYYKITLEVLEGNLPAQKSYEKFGFAGYELDPQMGKAMFWQKVITY